MYIQVDRDGAFSVHEAQSLTSLKLMTPLSHIALTQALQRNQHVGCIADSEHVWISQAWLFSHGVSDDPTWAAKFAKMIDYARGKGWFHPTLPALRVHVERTGAQ